MKTTILHQSINLKGYESTIGMTSSNPKRTRKTAAYQGGGYKCLLRVLHQNH